MVIPGMSDSYLPVTSMRQYLIWFYRSYGRYYRVFVVSRKRGCPSGYTSREMAHDYAAAIDDIGSPVHVLGLSLGSMIAQHLAADFSEKVQSLILSLGSPRSVPETFEIARRWIELAYREEWGNLYADTVDLTFTGFHRVLWQRLMPVLIRRPKVPSDFIVSIEACMHHDARSRLGEIHTPTLVLGGKQDRLIPQHYYHELAELIPGATLHLLDGGHGVYEERKREFDSVVIRFLRSVSQ
ncbi:MAG: alpha/beta fold hydrolase [Gammaproteobacteria bacterium]